MALIALIDNLSINTECIAFIDYAADIYNFDDGDMPGVRVQLCTGKTFEFTGVKADEARAILCRSDESDSQKREKAIEKITFFSQLNDFLLPNVKSWPDAKLFNWLEERGYIWTDGVWEFC